jgi:hypothetical protein
MRGGIGGKKRRNRQEKKKHPIITNDPGSFSVLLFLSLAI